MGEYWPILLLLALSAIIATVMVAGSWLLGPKKNTPYKDSPYECGVAPIGSARERFPIKFYLVAMLFILFDIEVVFLWSWMATYKEWVDAGDPAALYSFWAIMVYMFLWFLGDAYVIRSGALQWEETETVLPAEQPGLPVPELPIAV
ncbi:MAG: NADH-quinone oxidoreductase subunit A [Fimbriimonadales bacterium]